MINRRMLDWVTDARDLPQLSNEERAKLCEELRALIFRRCADQGGHLATNLATVEFTVAMCSVIDPFAANVLFDGAHQAYTYKILTGRRDAFLTPGGVSTLTMACESSTDPISYGHAGAGPSMIFGLATVDPRPAALVLSDGSLGNGVALQGLSLLAELRRNVVVVVNANGASILDLVGGASRRVTDEVNVLTGMGFAVRHVAGHDVAALVDAMTWAFAQPGPVVVVARTVKGRGFRPAETDPTTWHYLEGGFNPLRPTAPPLSEHPEVEATVDEVIASCMATDDRLVAISASLPDDGLGPKVRASGRWHDVGIAEEHAVLEATARAVSGQRVVIATYASYLQRMHDQLLNTALVNDVGSLTVLLGEARFSDTNVFQEGIHDLATGIAGTQLGLNLIAPASVASLARWLRWTLTEDRGVTLVRLPAEPTDVDPAWSTLTNGWSTSAETLRAPGVILAFGDTLGLALALAERLGDVDVVAAETVRREDRRVVGELVTGRWAVTLEHHALAGGFGQWVASAAAEVGTPMLSLGIDVTDLRRPFTGRREDRLAAWGLTPEAAFTKVNTWRRCLGR